MQVLLFPSDEAALRDEIIRSWPEATFAAETGGLLAVEQIAPQWAAQRPLAFSRQMLPFAKRITISSVREGAEQVFQAVNESLPHSQSWQLHVVPRYRRAGSFSKTVEAKWPPSDAGRRRAELICTETLARLKQRRRQLLRNLQKEPALFTPETSLVQVLLASPEEGFLSVAPAPWPFTLRNMVWPFPLGEIPLAQDQAAPGRAFAKLIEAEIRLGRRIENGQTCVDLGAAPGSWTYVALQRGAQVLAVDRSPLRDDLMRNPRLRFERGDAFAFSPNAPVDWLLCDVIAAPQRSIDLALEWLRRGWARQFVVTIKFKGRDDYAQLDRLKVELPALASEWRLTRLCANKNEVCAFGVAAR